MKIGIISDIHGNLEALERVMDDMAEQSVDRVCCLGDILGYGPFPAECLAIVRRITNLILMGNHEDSVLHLAKAEAELNEAALAGVRFSRTQLSKSDLNFLATLPDKQIIDDLDLALAHGSYSAPSAWKYIFGEGEADDEMAHAPARILVVGHTHHPMLFTSVGGLNNIPSDSVELKRNMRYLINVGSVGQPRDLDNRASFVVYDSQTSRVAFRRIEYDIESAGRRILEGAGDPNFAHRLFLGW
jgi:predicted phosphodiesterase